jgi:hypothetical protein
MDYPPMGGAPTGSAFLALDDMVEVAEALREAYEHVTDNTYGRSKEVVVVFVADMVLRRKPYMLVTQEGFGELLQEVFTVDDRRDFLFTLYFTFGSRWGMTDERYSALAANLARSACPVGIGKEGNGAPTAITQRLTAFEDALPLLEANPWLVMILLLQTFIRVSPPKSN